MVGQKKRFMAKRKPKKRVNVKALPRVVITSKDGEIEIRPYSVIIRGSVETAALALAEDILKHLPKNPVWYDGALFSTKTYVEAISVTHYKDSGKYEVTLLRKDAINPDTWAALKKDVEKICNNLTAFI